MPSVNKIETISCKCGNVFAACSVNHIDAAWKIQREFYKVQGCVINETENDVKFTGKGCCEQRNNLFHIDDLLEEFRSEIEDDM